MFKVMPDSFFDSVELFGNDDQIEGVEYHDLFLNNLIEQEHSRSLLFHQEKEQQTRPSLDLTEFIKLLNYNRRWTYQGSLTTAPCSEGILWNVVDSVIPIRQSTLDKYVNMRKVEEDEIRDHTTTIPWLDGHYFEATKTHHPEFTKCQKHKEDKFMRLAVCNRKVLDTNDRPVYHIDIID